MQVQPEVAVTLSRDLYKQLRVEAQRLGLPLKWLVASIVVDTMESKPNALAVEPALS